MRIIIRNLIILLVVTISATNSYAATYPTIRLSENKTLVVNLNDWTNTDVLVSIKDMDGSILHSDKVQKGSILGKRYNLVNVPAGEYELIIEGSMKKAIQKLEIIDNALIIKTYEAEVVFKPAIVTNETSVNLNQLALGRDITFMLSDNSGVFFTKEYSGVSSINEKFDISSLPAGDYVAVVKGENQYDTYSFKK